MNKETELRRVQAHVTEYRFIDLPEWTVEGGETIEMTSGKNMTCRCGWHRWHTDEWSGNHYCLSCGKQA